MLRRSENTKWSGYNRVSVAIGLGMMEFWQLAIGRQFHAALEMLGNAMDACPDGVWFEPGGQTFWYLAFHALFWTDFYFSTADEEEFAPPAPFSRTEFEDGVLPERAYSKAELTAYLQHCHNRLDDVLARMDEGWITRPCPMSHRNMSNGELLLYNLRHVQHHAAQLNMLLRQRIDFAPAWVSKGGVKAQG